MKQVSLRIPDSFHSEVVAYADSIGVSLNQLALVALADYLSLRRAASPAHTVMEDVPDVPDVPEKLPYVPDVPDVPIPSYKKKSRKRHKR
jgi:hypothetical protein